MGTSCARRWPCPQMESASRSTGTGREGEVCQLPAGLSPCHQLLWQEVSAMGHPSSLAAPGRAIQPGLQGAKHVGMQSTSVAMEVKYRGGGWIWPQTFLCSSRTAAWGWGQALPPWSHQLSQWLLWKTQGCTDSCFQCLLWAGGESPATPTVELVSYSQGELASLQL